MELKLKCVICNKPAYYLFLGYSYCKKHKDEHFAEMSKVATKAKKPVARE